PALRVPHRQEARRPALGRPAHRTYPRRRRSQGLRYRACRLQAANRHAGRPARRPDPAGQPVGQLSGAPHMASPGSAPLFIGLMSGTSTDGVDAVLAEFPSARPPRILAGASLPMPAALRAEFLALNTPGHDELARGARAGNELARLYAQACRQVISDAGLSPRQLRAIGAHGQTVRHDPGAGYSVQINAPALLAELTGIDVVADFRSRDIAAGGQGAPLVPAFHQAVFQNGQPRLVLNLGGIANVTVLEPGQALRGFDTGPANVLLDLWCHEHTGALFDAGGRWAASGRTHEGLLAALYDSEPWFK